MKTQKNNVKTENEKWYNHFSEKKSSKISAEKNKRKEFNKSRDKYFDEKRRGITKKNKILETEKNTFKSENSKKIDAKIEKQSNMFDFNELSKDALYVLENFDQIVQGIRPLNSKQVQNLPKDIKTLSHQLTDERETRRTGYMNANHELSAYVRYFAWWNLVRLTRVFANLPTSAFNLNDNDVLLDIGSGPFTVVIALWLSRPELRNKKLTVYAMDISQSTMSLGEDLYLSVAAKTPPSNKNAESHWNIIRIKGGIGTPLRKKVNFITSANMFNELYQKEHESPEEIANRQIQNLLNYADKRCSFFIAEPGMPVAGRFISLMRERFIKNHNLIIAPCPHQGKCAMDGNHARYGGSAKWCNFSFSTENAPKKLLKLSEQSGLPKERAVISFIFATSKTNETKNNINEEYLKNTASNITVVSDPIWIPEHKAGFYSCSEKGMILLINSTGKNIKSGEKIKMSMLKNIDILEKDKKSGAIKINV